MKTLDTLEANKLIAEFHSDRAWTSNNRPVRFYEINKEVWTEEMLDYKSSWDWLMPVVKKITDLHNQYTYFHAGHILDEIKTSLYDVDIESTFEYVVEFIKWHNNDKKL